ncbi:MAG: c-type cytochrome [Candidatus Eremiobacteraeota bacterium]|nr:c-type cytochrome [Candidatus Eremiobacteraeota bacterium]
MKQLAALLGVLIAASLLMSACSKNDQSSSSTTTTESAAPGGADTASPPPPSPDEAAHGALPIPLAKLPTSPVGSGSAAAGAKVFSANCASCHGVGGKNGNVGPSLAGVGLKAGQVAYMVKNPQGVDKSSGMPKLPLTSQQIADVSAYVASLK